MSTPLPHDALRAMNTSMTERLLGAPASPIPAAGYGLRVLEVVGRASGAPVRTPIGVLNHHDQLFLVCPDRTRDWPRNLSAAGTARLLSADGVQNVRAAEVHGTTAAEVVAAYLAAVTTPWAVAAFAVPAGAGATEIEPHLARMAVFALVADDSPGR